MPNRPVIAALIALPLVACAGGEWPRLAGPPPDEVAAMAAPAPIQAPAPARPVAPATAGDYHTAFAETQAAYFALLERIGTQKLVYQGARYAIDNGVPQAGRPSGGRAPVDYRWPAGDRSQRWTSAQLELTRLSQLQDSLTALHTQALELKSGAAAYAPEEARPVIGALDTLAGDMTQERAALEAFIVAERRQLAAAR